MAEQPQSDGGSSGEFPIRLEAVLLHELEFRVVPEVEETTQLKFSFALNAARIAADGLRVLFRLEGEGGGVNIDVEYIGGVRILRPIGNDDSTEYEAWQRVAAGVVPHILFPFIRETVHSVVGKSPLNTPPLPIVNFRDVFSPDEIEIEDWDAFPSLHEASEIDAAEKSKA